VRVQEKKKARARERVLSPRRLFSRVDGSRALEKGLFYKKKTLSLSLCLSVSLSFRKARSKREKVRRETGAKKKKKRRRSPAVEKAPKKAPNQF
jgi:hypothetical protein